jgi:hypothetical protein
MYATFFDPCERASQFNIEIYGAGDLYAFCVKSLQILNHLVGLYLIEIAKVTAYNSARY